MLWSDEAWSPWSPDAGGDEGSFCDPLMNKVYKCGADWKSKWQQTEAERRTILPLSFFLALQKNNKFLMGANVSVRLDTKNVMDVLNRVCWLFTAQWLPQRHLRGGTVGEVKPGDTARERAILLLNNYDEMFLPTAETQWQGGSVRPKRQFFFFYSCSFE